MKFSNVSDGAEQAVIDLFTATFAASEGAAEGAMIGGLVARQLAETPPDDIRVFTAWDGATPVGGAVFTRLAYPDDPRAVVLLSPMAVATDRQGQGIGQALLRHALAALRAERVDVAMTYGDPAFYGKVGFMPVSLSTVPPPHPLSQPEGWVGQSLTGKALPPLKGPCTCVAALDDPAFW